MKRVPLADPVELSLVMNQPTVPEWDDYAGLLRQIFDAKWMTNFGEMHQRFESALRSRMDVDHVLPVTNATVGLMTVLRALDVQGEVITTPFSFPATHHVLLNCPGVRPVFADISGEDFGLEPDRVREAIGPETGAILAVHALGVPGRVCELEEIARERGIPLIFDAAPCFGVRYRGRDLTSYGDASVLSFHATKVFHTAEGGAIVSSSPDVYERCRTWINFGIQDEDTIVAPGLNGKMDELRCALGLVNLPGVDGAIGKRRRVVEAYLRFFRENRFEGITVPLERYRDPDVELNYSYFPLLVEPGSGRSRDSIAQALRSRGVIARKYYWPTILDHGSFPGPRGKFPVAGRISGRILCLPVNPHFGEAETGKILDDLEQVLEMGR